LATFGGASVAEMELARQWLDGLEASYVALPGNHDLARAGSAFEEPDPVAPLAETNFGRVFGGDAIVIRDVGPVRVVAITMRPGDPDGVLPRLDDLVRSDSRPVLLSGHYPLAPVRETSVLAEVSSEKFAGETADGVLDVIRRHSNIVAYACGHIHASSVRQLTERCVQVTAGSLGQGSATYRIYDVEARSMVVRTMMGHGPLDFWGRKFPELRGQPDYHLGGAGERTVWIDW
jgi:hypothetical protein